MNFLFKFGILFCFMGGIASFSSPGRPLHLASLRRPLLSTKRDTGNSNTKSTGPTGMVRIPQKVGDEKSNPRTQLSLREVFTPPYADGYSIALTLAGQGLLVNLGFMASIVYGFFDSRSIGLDTFSFDNQSMTMATMFAMPLIILGFIIDQLPISPFKEIARDTRIFVLRLLGRNSSWLNTILVALLLSCTAGFAEELVFRGVLMRGLDNITTFPIGLIISSAIFGFAHFPIFGASAGVEAVLGGVFGYAYWMSGYNIAVPIALHTMYDFFTIIVTWVTGAADLKRRIKQATIEEAQVLKKLPEAELELLSNGIFDLLDSNGDGRIDLAEMRAGLQFYAYGALPLGVGGSSVEAVFKRADKNNDGLVDRKEFLAAIKDDLQTIQSWQQMGLKW